LKRISLLIVVSLFALLVLAGCAAQANNIPTEEAKAEPQRVEVTLTEFAVESSITDFEVGRTYEFVITNEGVIEHELRIIPPMDANGSTPHGDDLHGKALVVVEAENLGPGETATIQYTFDEHDTEQPLEFACHIMGHYEANMRLPMTLK
jgi:uncharacterized cupredoxin-like copper-binding protein